MAYQITLSDQEYAALATEAAKSGLQPEALLHEMIQRLQSFRRKYRQWRDEVHARDEARRAREKAERRAREKAKKK